MEIKLINIGYGNLVAANRLVTILSPESSPIRRAIKEAKAKGILIDATFGRKTRSVIITDCDNIILSAVNPETINSRLESNENNDNNKFD